MVSSRGQSSPKTIIRKLNKQLDQINILLLEYDKVDDNKSQASVLYSIRRELTDMQDYINNPRKVPKTLWKS